MKWDPGAVDGASEVEGFRMRFVDCKMANGTLSLAHLCSALGLGVVG